MTLTKNNKLLYLKQNHKNTPCLQQGVWLEYIV